MMSNWVGYACSYAPYGAMQWRLPLGIQIPWGVIMFCGLVTFMPNSPRHLIRNGKPEQARAEFARIRRDLEADELEREFTSMIAQIEYESEREITSYREIWKLYRSRVMVYVVPISCGPQLGLLCGGNHGGLIMFVAANQLIDLSRCRR